MSADYLQLVSGNPEVPPESQRITSAIGMLRRS